MHHDIIMQPHQVQVALPQFSSQSGNLQSPESLSPLRTEYGGRAIPDLPVGFVPFTLAVLLDIVHRSFQFPSG